MTYPNVRNTDPANNRTPKVRVMIIGVGGGGSNAVDNMIDAGVKVDQFMAINTDYQALCVSSAKKRVQIGSNVTGGHGAGANPEKGRQAAEECRETLKNLMEGMDLIFITAGMGGGTGTGAAPVIAEIAHELNKLVLAFVTTPFKFEGEVRMRNARAGIAKLREVVDSIIIVPNEKLATVAKDLSTEDAFKYADDILRQGVQATTDIIANPGRINVDFADVCTVLAGGGDAIMGIGRASGSNRAIESVKKAVNNNVLDTSIEGATRAIVNIEGADIKMEEVTKAAALISDICAPDANIIFGHDIVKTLKDEMQVTIIATGFRNGVKGAQQQPQQQQPQQPPRQMQGRPQQYDHAQQYDRPPVRPDYYQNRPPAPDRQRMAQQSFDDLFAQQPPVVQPQPYGDMNNGYVGMDDDSDLAWLRTLNNGKKN